MEGLGGFQITGLSQSGKSSFVNAISGENLAAIGSGNGESTTTDSVLYTIGRSPLLGTSIIIADIPGFEDSGLYRSDSSILATIALNITSFISKNISFKGFILTESILSGRSCLLPCLLKLFSICGPEVKDSILVIATKSDLLIKYANNPHHLQTYRKKYDGIVEICKKMNIRQIQWSNEISFLPPLQRERQVNQLKNSLRGMRPFNSHLLTNLQSDITRIAKILAAKQKIPTKNDIKALAVRLANESEPIRVEKVRFITKLRRYKIPDGYHKTWNDSDLNNENWKGNPSRYTWGEHEDILAEPYFETERPSFELFLDEANRRLKPKDFTEFKDKAIKIKEEELKKILLAA